MKNILILADGMADEPIENLGGQTPMEAAETPMMDWLAAHGEVGLLKTVPDGMSPGSDTANLSIIGYNPLEYYTGRSPLEARSIGIQMKESDVCFRVNFVTLSEEENYWEKTIEDHSADEITTEEAEVLLEAIKMEMEKEGRTFYRGVSYRHALIWEQGSTQITLEPPHDLLGQKITDYQPKGEHSQEITALMEQSYLILNNHPVNEARRQKGLRPANSLWLWGEGVRPELPSFAEKYNKKGAMISAVDLLKGIALAAEMKSIHVEGATGNIHTNYQGKVEAAIQAFESDIDFVYLHVEAPDECGHRGEQENKIKSIEYIDQKIIKPLYTYLKEQNIPFKMAVLPDHPTPLRIRTHTCEPVPYLIYSSDEVCENTHLFSEAGGRESGMFIDKGYQFMTYFLEDKI